MSMIDQLGVALGLATLAGINLYLTTLVTGLAIRFHWLHLSGPYEQLNELANPWVLGVAAVLYAVEFFADKIPWIDSLWDIVHTLIRPAGGIFLALAALGKMDASSVVIATLVAGTASLSTHGTKAGVRAFLNLSPEPVTNSVASASEDGLVLAGLGLIAASPAVAFFLFAGVILLCAFLTYWLWRKIFRRRKSASKALVKADAP